MSDMLSKYSFKPTLYHGIIFLRKFHSSKSYCIPSLIFNEMSLGNQKGKSWAKIVAKFVDWRLVGTNISKKIRNTSFSSKHSWKDSWKKKNKFIRSETCHLKRLSNKTIFLLSLFFNFKGFLKSYKMSL